MPDATRLLGSRNDATAPRAGRLLGRAGSFARKNWRVLIGVAVLAVLVLADLPEVARGERLAPPSSEHPFGVDDARLDRFDQCMVGLFQTTRQTALAAALSLVLALTVMSLATLSGVVRAALQVALRQGQVLPGLLLALVLAKVENGPMIATVMVGVLFLVGALLSGIRDDLRQPYVLASRGIGATAWWLCRWHLLRRLVARAAAVMGVLLAELVGFIAALDVLGVVGAGTPDESGLARLVISSLGAIEDRPVMVIAPALFLIGLGTFFVVMFSPASRLIPRAPRSRPWGSTRDPHALSELALDPLRVQYGAVTGIDISVADARAIAFRPGRIVGIVGLSGGGKSSLASAIAGVLPGEAKVTGDTRPVLVGSQVALVTQRAGLVPWQTVAGNLSRAWALRGVTATSTRIETTLSALGLGGLARKRPTELSGGQLKRAQILLPEGAPVLLFDEPTAGLDPESVDDLAVRLRALASGAGAASDDDAKAGRIVLVITHDLGWTMQVADDVLIVNGGRVAQWGAVSDALTHPSPTLQALLRVLPHATRTSRPDSADDQPTDHARTGSVEPDRRESERAADGAAEASPDTATGDMAGKVVPSRQQPLPQIEVIPGSAEGFVLQEPAAWVLTPMPEDAPPVLIATGLVREYHVAGTDRIVGVHGVDLTVRKGEIVGIEGPSGSGKSTLCRLLAQLEDSDAGTLRVGAPTARRNARVGYLPQGLENLDPQLTVINSLRHALSMRKTAGANPIPRAQIRDHLAATLRAYHLVGLAERYPDQLSGGQRQRTALARAILAGAPIVILDEPESALDSCLRASLANTILEIGRARETALVWVSHDPTLLRHTCDRVLTMRDGLFSEST